MPKELKKEIKNKLISNNCGYARGVIEKNSTHIKNLQEAVSILSEILINAKLITKKELFDKLSEKHLKN